MVYENDSLSSPRHSDATAVDPTTTFLVHVNPFLTLRKTEAREDDPTADLTLIATWDSSKPEDEQSTYHASFGSDAADENSERARAAFREWRDGESLSRVSSITKHLPVIGRSQQEREASRTRFSVAEKRAGRAFREGDLESLRKAHKEALQAVINTFDTCGKYQMPDSSVYWMEHAQNEENRGVAFRAYPLDFTISMVGGREVSARPNVSVKYDGRGAVRFTPMADSEAEGADAGSILRQAEVETNQALSVYHVDWTSLGEALPSRIQTALERASETAMESNKSASRGAIRRMG